MAIIVKLIQKTKLTMKKKLIAVTNFRCLVTNYFLKYKLTVVFINS